MSGTTTMPTLRIDRRGSAPAWAARQRELLDRLVSLAPEFVERYTRPDGSLIWRERWPGMDGSDDPYEGFMYLALLYSLSGDETVYRLARSMWDSITWQWTQYGQIEREFDKYYDWMHHGEANLFHYFFGLGKPDSLVDRQRAHRFARMYTGEDPLAPNFDRERWLIRAPQSGSTGPRFVVTAEDLSTHRGVLDDYLPPFEDLETAPFPADTCNWSDDAVFAEIIRKMNERTTRGDVPINLNATGQMTHAYLYSGDPALRDWVTRYLAGWKARADANGGIIPDNVGLDGEVGQYLGGRWWGGHYGWRWPHGLLTIVEPAINAGANALLLTGDASWFDLARNQIDASFALGRDIDGVWHIPHKHFDSGWTDFRPASPLHLIHIWARTFAAEDRARIDRVPRTFDWSTVTVPRVPLTAKHHIVNTAPWYQYAIGEFPEYPELALDANAELVDQQVRRMRSADGDPRTWDRLEFLDGHTEGRSFQVDGYAIHAWQELNPIIVESIVQLAWGTPMHISHGGLQHATVRYFDGATGSPGFPPDVAALVRELAEDRVVLEVVNLSTVASRRLVVQAGGFREHRFTSIDSDDVASALDTEWVELDLAPGTTGRVELGMRRYCADPSYETPWSRREDWDPLIVGREAESA